MSINLLPWRERRAQWRKKLLYVSTALIAMMLIIGSASYYYFAREKQNAWQQQTLDLLEKVKAVTLGHHQKTYDDLQQKITLALQQRESLSHLLTLLYDSTQSLPPTVALTALGWQKPFLSLHGNHQTTTDIAPWLQQLSDNKFVRAIKPTYHHDNKNNLPEFTLQLEGK